MEVENLMAVGTCLLQEVADIRAMLTAQIRTGCKRDHTARTIPLPPRPRTAPSRPRERLTVVLAGPRTVAAFTQPRRCVR